VARVMELTGGLGADVSFEAVGVPETFELAADLIRPGGRVANIGVHGRSAQLRLEKLWIRDVTITTGLVDTFSIPQLMRLIASGRLDPSLFATHRFALGDTMTAYDTFADAASSGALKVVLQGGNGSSRASASEQSVAVA
jgi:alcohol dehydrogenase